MSRRRHLALALCLLTAPAFAQVRQPVDIGTAPFAAVGQVNNGSYGRCTGTLVAPLFAVTAAHCLFNRATGRFVRPQSVHFVLGAERGTYRFQSTAAAMTIGPGYDPARPSESVANDWALLRLETPAPDAIAALQAVTGELPAGGRVTAAGFGRDRAHVLTATGCVRTADRFPGVLGLSCPLIEGYSGAPLIDDAGRIAGHVVAVGRQRDGTAVVLAVPASVWRGSLE